MLFRVDLVFDNHVDAVLGVAYEDVYLSILIPTFDTDIRLRKVKVINIARLCMGRLGRILRSNLEKSLQEAITKAMSFLGIQQEAKESCVRALFPLYTQHIENVEPCGNLFKRREIAAVL